MDAKRLLEQSTGKVYTLKGIEYIEDLEGMVERLKEYIGQLEHENKLLYGRLNTIRDLTNKEVK